MSEVPTLKAILSKWVHLYDDKIPINKEDRQLALVELLRTLVGHGYKSEDIGTFEHDTIIKACVPQGYKKLDKKATWQRMVERDLLVALEVVFPSVEMAEATPEDLLALTVKKKLDREIQKDFEPDEVPLMGKGLIMPDPTIVPDEAEYDEDILKELGMEE